MTLSDARKILGLNPDENTRPHLHELENARERIAELVKTSPNPTLADRYRKGLEEFDQALALIREHLEGPPAFVTGVTRHESGIGPPAFIEQDGAPGMNDAVRGP